MLSCDVFRCTYTRKIPSLWKPRLQNQLMMMNPDFRPFWRMQLTSLRSLQHSDSACVRLFATQRWHPCPIRTHVHVSHTEITSHVNVSKMMGGERSDALTDSLFQRLYKDLQDFRHPADGVIKTRKTSESLFHLYLQLREKPLVILWMQTLVHHIIISLVILESNVNKHIYTWG